MSKLASPLLVCLFTISACVFANNGAALAQAEDGDSELTDWIFQINSDARKESFIKGSVPLSRVYKMTVTSQPVGPGANSSVYELLWYGASGQPCGLERRAPICVEQGDDVTIQVSMGAPRHDSSETSAIAGAVLRLLLDIRRAGGVLQVVRVPGIVFDEIGSRIQHYGFAPVRARVTDRAYSYKLRLLLTDEMDSRRQIYHYD
jgi:hypothetical protein